MLAMLAVLDNAYAAAIDSMGGGAQAAAIGRGRGGGRGEDPLGVFCPHDFLTF